MFYNFSANNLPHITRIYSAARNTPWMISESSNLLIYILEGKCSIELEGTTYQLETNNIIFIPANHYYIRKSHNDEYCLFLYIHFDIDTEIQVLEKEEAISFLAEFKNLSEKVILDRGTGFEDKHFFIYNLLNFQKSDSEIRTCVNTILEYTKNQYAESPLMISSAIYQIMALMTHSTMTNFMTSNQLRYKNPVPKEIKNTIFYINNHHNSQITIDDLCKHSNLSSQQLLRYFKKFFNKTPTQYILETKIYHAKALLMSNLTIQELSAEVGFSDQHYFSRVFKKITGESPSSYRNSIRKSDASLTDGEMTISKLNEKKEGRLLNSAVKLY